jgi:hypothetical protein
VQSEGSEGTLLIAFYERYRVRLKRLLHEPLLHFLLIGIALFVVYGKVAAPNRAGTSIVVSEAMVDEMAREHEARWTRKPSDQELAGLVDAYVRDEILYREGLALGLDRDDALIKRRVRQKFEVIAEEQSAREPPSDADLTAYITANEGRFLLPATASFEQIFFDNARTPADVERAVAAARVALAHGADPRKLGQASMLPGRIENAAQEKLRPHPSDSGADRSRRVSAHIWCALPRVRRLRCRSWTGFAGSLHANGKTNAARTRALIATGSSAASIPS